MDVRKEIRKVLEEMFNENKQAIFFRKTKSPKNDLKRNFSCYVGAWFDDYESAFKHYKEESVFSQEPKQDPVTKMWCGHVEDGLSGYIVRNKKEFEVAIYELTKYYPHLKDINEISVFSSKNYSLESGSDGEDTFEDAKYLFNIPINSTYKDFLKILNSGSKLRIPKKD